MGKNAEQLSMQDTKFSNKINTSLIRKKVRPEIPEITLHPDNVNGMMEHSSLLTVTEKMLNCSEFPSLSEIPCKSKSGSAVSDSQLKLKKTFIRIFIKYLKL